MGKDRQRHLLRERVAFLLSGKGHGHVVSSGGFRPFFKSRMLRHGASPQDDCFLSLLSPATRSRHVSPASPPAERPLPFGHRSRLRRAGVRRKRPSPVLRHQRGRRDRLCPAAFVLRPVFRPSRPAAMAGQSRTQGLRRLPQQAPSASRRPAPSSPAPHPAGRLLASGPSRLRTPPCSPLRRSPQSRRCTIWGTPVLPNRGPGTRCMAAPLRIKGKAWHATPAKGGSSRSATAEAHAMSAPQRTCLPRGCDASPGTAARLPERKSLQQTPEEDTSKQDSVR